MFTNQDLYYSSNYSTQIIFPHVYTLNICLQTCSSSSFKQNVTLCMYKWTHGHHTVTKKTSNSAVEDKIILYNMIIDYNR